MNTTECPNCDALIEVRTPIKVGDLVKCGSCHESLVVIWTDPLELDWPYEEDSSDDDEWPYDDEDDEEYEWDEDFETEEDGGW